MTFCRTIRRTAVGTGVLALVSVVGLATLARGEEGKAAGTANLVPALSLASATYHVSFMGSGIVRELSVKPGDVVKAGQVLARQDSDLDELDLKAARLAAEGAKKEIQAQEKDRDAKKIELDNKKQAIQTNSVTESEVREAQLQFDEASIKVEADQQAYQQKLAEADTKAKRIEKMQVISPADGIVQKLSLQVGEIFDPGVKNEGALTIVKNDPLWVEMHIPSAQAAKLKLGDTLEVAYGEPDAVAGAANVQWQQATVIFLDPLVDATTDKRTVRLEVPNKDNLPGGLQVAVKVPLGDAAGTARAGQ